jgi:HPt (histidine-containing phosphotransfer) domain-containing protein
MRQCTKRRGRKFDSYWVSHFFICDIGPDPWTFRFTGKNRYNLAQPWRMQNGKPKMNDPVKPTQDENTVAAPIDAMEWRRRLDGIAGLNAELGLYRIRGNLDAYKRILAAFVSGHAEEVSELADALAAGNLPTLKEIAHSLKGSGGTIGAERLAEAATKLDSALRNQAATSEIAALSSTLIAELAILIEGIRSALKG